jgi:hypothetical protein
MLVPLVLTEILCAVLFSFHCYAILITTGLGDELSFGYGGGSLDTPKRSPDASSRSSESEQLRASVKSLEAQCQMLARHLGLENQLRDQCGI